jgi:hypothetical protein
MNFHLCVDGSMAFMPRADKPMLLVADMGTKFDSPSVVQIIDVRAGIHDEYVISMEMRVQGARGVAASPVGSHVAVSCFTDHMSSPHKVLLFVRGSDTTIGWCCVRTLGAARTMVPSRPWDGAVDDSAPDELWCPQGLRFSSDGDVVLVTTSLSNRLSLFRVSDGQCVTMVTNLPGACDVEDTPTAWAITCYSSNAVVFVDKEDPTRRLAWRTAAKAMEGVQGVEPVQCPSNLGWVPGAGLVLRQRTMHGAIKYLFTEDEFRMHVAMSVVRVGWMCAVALAAQTRQRGAQATDTHG